VTAAVGRRASDEAALPALERLRSALVAVGHGDAASLSWVQDFAARPLGDPASAEQAANELVMFCARRPGWSKSWMAQSRRAPKLQLSATADEVREAQRSVRSLLDGLRTTGFVWFPAPATLGLTWDRTRAVTLVTQGGVESQVLASLGELLVRVGARFQACARPACGRFFLWSRRWQTFCSARCGTSVRVARHRVKDPARASARRHERYVREVRRRLPPTAKVTIGRRSRSSR
jgi:hypothetical protein